MAILNLSDDEKILAARAEDYILRSRERSIVIFTDFLSEREKAVVLQKAAMLGELERAVVYGGYEDAERTVVGFFPEFSMYLPEDEKNGEFPVVALKIICSGFRTHTHRDFLGSILGLGLERTVIGDIIVGDDGFSAVAFVHSRIAQFICDDLKLVGRDGVKVELCNDFDAKEIKRNFQHISGTCASLRADALISEFLNISREKSQKLILDGVVCVNHSEITDKSYTVSLGDVITIRGYGKYRVSAVGDVNRKGRIRFEILKYI